MKSNPLQFVVDEIVANVESELQASGSALLEDEYIAAQMRSQFRDILNDVISPSEWSERSESASTEDISGRASHQIGRSRAVQAVHPSDSLDAANVLFRVALPALVRQTANSNGGDSALEVVRVANGLHSAIMARITPASIGYVDVLVEKLSVAQSEERIRISRELHDRVAHGIAAGIQRVDLGSRAQGSTRVEGSMFDSALEILRDALMDTRRIATDLRQVVGGRTLDSALSEYVNDIQTFGEHIQLESIGIPVKLSAMASEEAFLIIREALRNASVHAAPAKIEVKLDWGESNVVVTVRDDGVGFVTSQLRPNSMGLITMHERAEIIGGEVQVQSSIGVGTTVTLEINVDRANHEQ